MGSNKEIVFQTSCFGTGSLCWEKHYSTRFLCPIPLYRKRKASFMVSYYVNKTQSSYTHLTYFHIAPSTEPISLKYIQQNFNKRNTTVVMCRVTIHFFPCGDETFEQVDCKWFKQEKGNISLWKLVRGKKPQPCPYMEYVDIREKKMCGQKDCRLKRKHVGMVPLKETARGTTGFLYEEPDRLPRRRPPVPTHVQTQTRANAEKLIDRSKQTKRPEPEHRRPVRQEAGPSGRHRPPNDHGHHDRGHRDRPNDNRQRVARPPSPRTYADTRNTQRAGHNPIPATTKQPVPRLRRTDERFPWKQTEGTARPTAGRVRPNLVINDEGTRMGRVKEREVIARKPRHVQSKHGLVVDESHRTPPSGHPTGRPQPAVPTTRHGFESRLPTPKPQVPMKSPLRGTFDGIVRPANPRPSHQRERQHRPTSGYLYGGHEVRNSATRIPAPQVVNRHGHGNLTGQQPPRETRPRRQTPWHPPRPQQPVPPPAKYPIYPPRAPTMGRVPSPIFINPVFHKRPTPPPPPKKKKAKTNWFKKLVKVDSDTSSLDFKCVGEPSHFQAQPTYHDRPGG